MQIIRTIIKTFWRTLNKPSAHYTIGFLSVGGFIAGILFWGGFNTALELTNTEKFCISCHEMRNNVYAELRETIHFSNRTGVRATCPDCHVPHDWGDKVTRKIKATKELWGWFFGKINTKEKFERHRLEMAQREWARMEANNSLECRNCHNINSMDFTLQSARAATAHNKAIDEGITCIGCHKGIAHDLPNPQSAAAQ